MKKNEEMAAKSGTVKAVEMLLVPPSMRRNGIESQGRGNCQAKES